LSTAKAVLFFMIKKNLYIVVYILLAVSAKSQNLVPNPSFENFPSVNPQFCDCGALSSSWGCAPIDTVFLTPPWYSPTSGSPDCFKPCSPSLNYKVPKNLFGFQYPKTGIGYASVCCRIFCDVCINVRSYIQVKLSEQLEAGKQYNAEFFISQIDSSNYAIDRIGMYISDTAVWLPLGNMFVLPFVPQISNPEYNYITDTAIWVKISGVYTAHGGEQYITIGNFYDDVNTHQILTDVGSDTHICAFYIDDVSVTLINEPEKDNLVYVPNIFSPNHDGQNDVFRVRCENIETLHLTVYNRWGENVFESQNKNDGWDGNYKGKPCSPDVYVYHATIVFEDGTETSRKGNVTLVR